jgi:hypothetical protein
MNEKEVIEIVAESERSKSACNDVKITNVSQIVRVWQRNKYNVKKNCNYFFAKLLQF